MAENPAFDDHNDTIGDLTELDDSELTPENAEEFGKELAEYLSQKKNVNVVVAGKTGVGKSTLIGSLLPDQVKQVAVKDGSASCDRYVLQKYEGIMGECPVSVYDTHGFCAAQTKSQDAKLLAEKLRREFSPQSGRKIDLFIFCHEMFGRFDDASLTSLTFFGALLKRSDWNVCVVALTKANLYPPSVEGAEDPAAEMIALQKFAKKDIQEKYFTPRGLFEESEKIPFVPVGYKTEKIDKRKLHCCEDSIKQLAKECILRCNPDSALVLASAFSMANIPVKAIVGGVTAATVLGTAGAVVGGLLTFYAGGVGAIPAGVAGAAIGAVIGGGIGGAGATSAIGAKEATQYVMQRFIGWRKKNLATFKKEHN